MEALTNLIHFGERDQGAFVELEDAIHRAERAQVGIWLRFLESSSFPTYKNIFMAMPKSSTLAWQ